MKSEFEQNLEKYAEVIVKVGLNIQPGQRLLIGPPLYGFLGVELEVAPLVRLIAAKAYQAGAKLVDVIWRDDLLNLIRLQEAPGDSFGEFATWQAQAAIETARKGDAVLLLVSRNTSMFIDQDPASMNEVFMTSMKHMKPFLDLRGQKKMNFVIASAPNKTWADLVYPDLPEEERLLNYWEELFEFCRINQPDPIGAWNEHIKNLKTRKDYFNEKQYKGLHFYGPGTDLRVVLPAGHVWSSGGKTTQSGIEFVANLPTEEIFTLPHKDKVDGVVTSSKPISSSRGFIEGLRVEFSNGKVVNMSAETGEEIFSPWLDIDEGINHLGEVALVPHSSPISQSGRIFHNLLFDENASCHLALGNGYRFCLKGGEKMSEEEFMLAGGNNSSDHIDFMIGSEEMDVDGILDDGSTEPIMRGGEWAFDI